MGYFETLPPKDERIWKRCDCCHKIFDVPRKLTTHGFVCFECEEKINKLELLTKQVD